jgi:SAM-dependent methyltransferase
MPPSAWLRFPAAWLRSRGGPTPERPWIVPAAIGWLRRRIRSDWSILELGSGRSTAWFAKRAGHMISLEDNEFWHDWTRERVERDGLANVDLRLSPVEEFPRAVGSLPDDAFDLVVIDCLEAPGVTRVDCIAPAREKVQPGGHLLLDDSDRPGYAEAFELLADWPFRSFTGIKDEWPEACETGIFTRPRTPA